MILKAKIEAILFLTSKPIKAAAIARIVNADVQLVRQALLELINDYDERKGGLEIADEDGYSFQVREEYASMMDEFMPVEMSAALIRTLSAIAIKQPVMQSEIIRVRGAGAYDHIRELVIKDLVSKKEEQGERSPYLSTTKKFQEYFKLSKDGKDLRNFLKKQVRKANAAEAGDGADEKQLVISDVVTTKTDEFINSGIYLETADVNLDDLSLNDITAAEAVTLDRDANGAEAVTLNLDPAASDESPNITVGQVAATAAGATDVLNKLATTAAEAKEPEASEEDFTPPPSSTSTVQANNVKRAEPKMGTFPDDSAATEDKSKTSRQTPSLLDLLAKQKTLEKQLKVGKLTGRVADDGAVDDDDQADLGS